jgi:crossover junction endodeoxyribonuclease RusA
MKACTLTLPWPPSVNHYKQPGRLTTTKTGKLYQTRVDTQETKTFYYNVWVKIYKLKLKEGLKSFHDATIVVEVDAHPPDHRKRDLDGILKVLLDSMQRANLYNDDAQIARLLVQRKDIIEGGQVVVRVSLLK